VTCCLPQLFFEKKSDDSSSEAAQIPVTMVAEKSGFNFFYSKNVF
jgi:hypothetical protein